MLTRTSKLFGVTLTLGIVFLTGCSPKEGASPGKFRTVTVQPVTHFGQVLDEDTGPQEVVYALLRAIRDDALATSKAQREAAIDIQFDLAAANIIQARNVTGLSADEYVDRVVRHWTPTVAFYADDLESDWDKARPRLQKTTLRKSDLGSGPVADCEVLMELADPGGDPNAQVLLFVWMAKDHDLWRVIHLGFKNNVRSIEGLRALAFGARSRPSAGGQ